MRRIQFYFILIIFSSACNRQQSISPQRKDIVESVYASGEVIPAGQYFVNSLVEGYLSKKIVNEGEPVKKGTHLFYITSEQSEVQLKNSLDNLSVASQNYSNNSAILGPLYAQLDAARVKQHTDSLNYERYRKLKETGAVSQVEFEQVNNAWQNSKTQVKSLEDNIRSVRDELYLQLTGAQGALATSVEAHNNYLLTSEIDGKVYRVYKEQGELVKRGDLLAMLGKADSMLIRLNIQDEDISKIAPGQDVLVEFNTHPGHIFKAKVSKIFPAFDAQDQSFKIEALLTEAPEKIFAGTQVIANIVITTRKNALVIPKNYVNANNEVLLKKNQATRRIHRGLEDAEMVEVLSGLDEDDFILKQK